MKATGIIRKIDSLGRIVLPIELRRTMGIQIKDPVEIFVDKEYILLKKYAPSCVLCGGDDALVAFRGRNVCKNCIEAVKNNNNK